MLQTKHLLASRKVDRIYPDLFRSIDMLSEMEISNLITCSLHPSTSLGAVANDNTEVGIAVRESVCLARLASLRLGRQKSRLTAQLHKSRPPPKSSPNPSNFHQTSPSTNANTSPPPN